MAFGLHLSSDGDSDQHQSKDSETSTDGRHHKIVTLAKARRIQHKRKIGALQVGMLLIPSAYRAFGDLRRNCRQRPRELNLMAVRRRFHQQEPLLNHQCDDFRASLVVVACIHFSHPRRERFLALHFHEIMLRPVGIRDGNQLGPFDREWPESKVVTIPPARRQKQPQNSQNAGAEQKKVAAGPPDLPADEVIPHEVTSYPPARRSLEQYRSAYRSVPK